MQVQLDAKTVSLQLGNQGVDVKITDNRGRQLGTLRIGHATVEWRKGKLGPSTGRKLELSKFISEHLDLLGAAKPSAGRIAAAGPKRPVRPAKPSTGRATAVRRKRPNRSTAALTKPSTDSREQTSTGWHATRSAPCKASRSAAARVSASTPRAPSKTLAPSSSRRRTTPRPMPREAPVTIATRPSRPEVAGLGISGRPRMRRRSER